MVCISHYFFVRQGVQINRMRRKECLWITNLFFVLFATALWQAAAAAAAQEITSFTTRRAKHGARPLETSPQVRMNAPKKSFLRCERSCFGVVSNTRLMFHYNLAPCRCVFVPFLTPHQKLSLGSRRLFPLASKPVGTFHVASSAP